MANKNYENIKRWRKENPDKVREQRRRYYERHKRQIREYLKLWRAKKKVKAELAEDRTD